MPASRRQKPEEKSGQEEPTSKGNTKLVHHTTKPHRRASPRPKRGHAHGAKKNTIPSGGSADQKRSPERGQTQSQTCVQAAATQQSMLSGRENTNAPISVTNNPTSTARKGLEEKEERWPRE
ncbi:hypothetical protein V6N12_036749 [Hibiscus sabdariffa]|uniref:Uncharacterized protein n=1 Tax=Hibiscus sabdariffa TaxID=183260 RepID=A0ABR2B9B7_9ROSI